MDLAIFRKVEIINNSQRAITRSLLEIEKHLGHENCREFNALQKQMEQKYRLNDWFWRYREKTEKSTKISWFSGCQKLCLQKFWWEIILLLLIPKWTD